MRGPRGYAQLFRNLQKNHEYQKINSANVSELVMNHFEYWSDKNHINVEIFIKTLTLLNNKPSVIIETGTSAWGTDSTRLWDSYVRKYGGSVLSCDIRPEARKQLTGQLSKNTKCYLDDSVNFLHKYKNLKADLYFLDSFDVDENNPFPSAEHGLREFMAIEESFKVGSLVLIDDTPSRLRFETMPHSSVGSKKFIEDYGISPGKGALILKYLDKHFKYQVLCHDYALLVRIL
jgi:hypothetical protein